jgi:hypothetical protein
MKYQDNWEFVCYLYKILNKQCAVEFQPQAGKRSHADMIMSKTFYDASIVRGIGFSEHLGSGQVTPVNGKSSVSSELFSSNYVALIERLKGILTKHESDE